MSCLPSGGNIFVLILPQYDIIPNSDRLPK